MNHINRQLALVIASENIIAAQREELSNPKIKIVFGQPVLCEKCNLLPQQLWSNWCAKCSTERRKQTMRKPEWERIPNFWYWLMREIFAAIGLVFCLIKLLERVTK